MKTKVSPAAVGIFVLGALALGMIALLSFGGMSLFSRPQRFMVYFDESIHGLDLGSPVKLRGVRVGRVVDLAIQYDDMDATNRSVVAVTCELNRHVITDAKGAQLRVSGPQDIQMLVDRGLRAQLGVLGLATGLLFVELDFIDLKEHPPGEKMETARYVVVPAMRGAFSEAQASVNEILNNLKKVDFGGISREFKALLANANQKVTALDAKGLSEKVGRAADAVTTLTESPEIKQALANLNEALGATRAVAAQLDTQVGPVSAELKATLVSAQNAMKSLETAGSAARQFVQQQGPLGDELTIALRQIAEAAGALQNLANALERNPSALIVGKKKAEQ